MFYRYARVVYTLEDNIWDCARNCAAFQLQNLDRILLSRLEKPVLEMMMTERISKGLDNGFFAGGSAISNLGIVPISSSIGPLTIDEVHFTTTQLAGLYSVFVTALTHAGRLYLSMSFAEPLISPAHAATLVTNFTEQLSDCCN
jgi:hypothetical protein